MVAIWMFASGLLIVSALPTFIPIPALLIAAALFALSSITFPKLRKGLFFTLGLLISTWQVQGLVGHQLAHALDGTKQNLTFSIVGMPQERERSTVFVARVQKIECQKPECGALMQRQVRLSWYQPPHPIAAGQVWSAQVKLKRPRGFANPGGFDYQAWLLGQGVVATGYVHSEARLERQTFVWASVRSALAKHIDAAAGEGGFERFWPALLVADRSRVSADDWQTLQATGTVHLMAISGLHIGLISLWAFWFGKLCVRLWALSHRQSTALAAHYFPPLLSSSMAFLYAALAGFSVPTVRACVACLLMNLCWVVGVRITPINLLGCGVAVVAIAEPLAWQNQGFWLSFAAVFLLVHTMAGRLVRHPVLDSIALQLVLSFGLSVPLLWLGQGVSWVSPFANLVAVPVVSFLVVPALFLATAVSGVSLALSHWLLQALDWVFGVLWHYLLWLESVPQALLWAPQVLTAPNLVAAFIGILLALAPRGLHLRGLGAICVGLAVLIQPPAPPPLKLTVMDVGQGLSVVVQTPTQTWVYDTGPAFSDTFDAGSRITAPYLRAQGVEQIDLIVSHSDNDHSGGTAALLKLFDVGSLRLGEPLIFDHLAGAPSQQRCEQGQHWRAGMLEWEVLWPPASSNLEGNDASCVVLLQMALATAALDDKPEQRLQRTVSVLLTGDIDRSIESKLLPSLPRGVDLLIAPHHGSKSSSSVSFVRAVAPKVVVFSAGYNNRYGHPHEKIVARYLAQGARTYNTATSGALVFEWNVNDEAILETRVEEEKLWYR